MTAQIITQPAIALQKARRILGRPTASDADLQGACRTVAASDLASEDEKESAQHLLCLIEGEIA